MIKSQKEFAIFMTHYNSSSEDCFYIVVSNNKYFVVMKKINKMYFKEKWGNNEIFDVTKFTNDVLRPLYKI